MTEKPTNIDLSIPRRIYYSDEYSLTNCPECGSRLTKEDCTIFLCAKSETDEDEFMTSLSGSHFCKKCPVVVFDTDIVEQAAQLGISGGTVRRYIISGIVDFNLIPDNTTQLQIGCPENPLPLVRFLTGLAHQTVFAEKKPGRNDPCICGSGKKYKKCCG